MFNKKFKEGLQELIDLELSYSSYESLKESGTLNKKEELMVSMRLDEIITEYNLLLFNLLRDEQ